MLIPRRVLDGIAEGTVSLAFLCQRSGRVYRMRVRYAGPIHASSCATTRTGSLAVGYRVSPRGQAYLDRTRTGGSTRNR